MVWAQFTDVIRKSSMWRFATVGWDNKLKINSDFRFFVKRINKDQIFVVLKYYKDKNSCLTWNKCEVHIMYYLHVTSNSMPMYNVIVEYIFWTFPRIFAECSNFLRKEFCWTRFHWISYKFLHNSNSMKRMKRIPRIHEYLLPFVFLFILSKIIVKGIIFISRVVK